MRGVCLTNSRAGAVKWDDEPPLARSHLFFQHPVACNCAPWDEMDREVMRRLRGPLLRPFGWVGEGSSSWKNDTR